MSSCSSDLHIFDDPESYYPTDPESTLFNFSYKSFSLNNISCLGEAPLWGHVVSNAARYLCHKFIDYVFPVSNCTILELGSGHGLVGMVASLMGAKQVVLTDYPDEDLVANLALNRDTHLNSTNSLVLPLKWGSYSSFPLNEVFDIIIASDLVFNHSCHHELAETISHFLKPTTGVCYFAFSHHRPPLVDKDISFFSILSDYDLQFELIEKDESFRPLWEHDSKYGYSDEVRGPVHCYKIWK
ncbi:hypothetical protein RCL1_005218 [Eukaryota sp. TZLM3-RCL]